MWIKKQIMLNIFLQIVLSDWSRTEYIKGTKWAVFGGKGCILFDTEKDV